MQRNGQNPIRSDKGFNQAHGKFNQAKAEQARSAGMMQCPACKAEVPPKPGFRMQKLTCPKCGAAMHK